MALHDITITKRVKELDFPKIKKTLIDVSGKDWTLFVTHSPYPDPKILTEGKRLKVNNVGCGYVLSGIVCGILKYVEPMLQLGKCTLTILYAVLVWVTYLLTFINYRFLCFYLECFICNNRFHFLHTIFHGFWHTECSLNLHVGSLILGLSSTCVYVDMSSTYAISPTCRHKKIKK